MRHRQCMTAYHPSRAFATAQGAGIGVFVQFAAPQHSATQTAGTVFLGNSDGHIQRIALAHSRHQYRAYYYHRHSATGQVFVWFFHTLLFQ
ncbi:hypothetical protein HRbin36_02208 [bacterium HR36]|nr:hypothetical protein HRbin36_02208 [bacterium HR36]